MVLQVTLAILKPHITRAPYAIKCIRNKILENDFFVLRSRRTLLTPEQCEMFYAEHKDRFFFNRLVSFMSSGPVDAHIISRTDAVNKWRNLMGPTKTFCAQYTDPESIRGSYGLSDTRNATHGSDSKESAVREIKIFFPDFNLNQWFEEEEEQFRHRPAQFSSTGFVHQLKTSK